MHENTHGQGNQEKDDDMKESFGSLADDRFSDLADRHPAGPHGNDQGSKVMDSSNKECSENDPEHGWNPTPDHGNGGSQHGRESRNGGIVMSKENVFVGGDVVDVILKLMSRCESLGIQLKDSPS